MAIAAMENGADKIRINPGNIGGADKIKAVVDVAKERNIPIRVGVNSGSLEKELVEKYHAQLDYYGRALEQITGKKVKEKVLYSFTLGEACSLS